MQPLRLGLAKPSNLNRRVAVQTRAMAAATAPITVYVKGEPGNNLGACPFCHRVLLTLEAKHVPYKTEYIDFDNKPQWLIDVNQGKVPVIKEEGADFMPDSDIIVDYLEKKFPTPSLVSKAPAGTGSKVFPTFRGWMLGPDHEAKKAEFIEELKALNAHLAAHGPLFGGDRLDATDAAVAPKLHIALVALKYFKNYDLPAEFTALHKYVEAIKALPEWQKTIYSPEFIIKGWQRHLDGH